MGRDFVNYNQKIRRILMANIKYEIIEKVGEISESPKGWIKELNLISWNGRAPKYDLRDWAPDHEKMGKGITLSKEELKSLRDILNSIDLD
jgi:hypothetical protein